MLNLKGPASKYTYNGAWTDGKEICNITLKSLTWEWMWHLSKKKSKVNANSKEMDKKNIKGKIDWNSNLQCLIEWWVHMGI